MLVPKTAISLIWEIMMIVLNNLLLSLLLLLFIIAESLGQVTVDGPCTAPKTIDFLAGGVALSPTASTQGDVVCYKFFLSKSGSEAVIQRALGISVAAARARQFTVNECQVKRRQLQRFFLYNWFKLLEIVIVSIGIIGYMCSRIHAQPMERAEQVSTISVGDLRSFRRLYGVECLGCFICRRIGSWQTRHCSTFRKDFFLSVFCFTFLQKKFVGFYYIFFVINVEY
jgi:hypothetical protein